MSALEILRLYEHNVGDTDETEADLWMLCSSAVNCARFGCVYSDDVAERMRRLRWPCKEVDDLCEAMAASDWR